MSRVKYIPNHIKGNCKHCAEMCNGEAMFAKDFPYIANFVLQMIIPTIALVISLVSLWKVTR